MKKIAADRNYRNNMKKIAADRNYDEHFGILDDIVGRLPSGAPMTAQARQNILDGYIAYVEKHMPNVSREAALKSAVDLFIDAGDQYLDPKSKYFDHDLYTSLIGGE